MGEVWEAPGAGGLRSGLGWFFPLRNSVNSGFLKNNFRLAQTVRF